MEPITTTQLLDALNWRYATKKFDPEKKIPAETWEVLERALVLSPSSYGLQPWKFLVVKDASLREQLVEHSWNQRQVADASHLVVFAAKESITEADVDKLVSAISEARGLTMESLSFYKDMMMGDLVNGPRSAVIKDWSARQVYIALGNLMTCAALLGIDACPMEGFVPSKYDELLGLEGSGYAAVVACPLGYRSDDDQYATLPKVRYPAVDVIKRVGE